MSPPTAPQPKPSTESCIPVRPNTRISIAVPPPARADRARYSKFANYPSSPLSQKKSTLARADEDDPLGPLDQTDGKLHAPRARRFL
jgi:hypothetical protein